MILTEPFRAEKEAQVNGSLFAVQLEGDFREEKKERERETERSGFFCRRRLLIGYYNSMLHCVYSDAFDVRFPTLP
jgi:hypothetical protein